MHRLFELLCGVPLLLLGIGALYVGGIGGQLNPVGLLVLGLVPLGTGIKLVFFPTRLETVRDCVGRAMPTVLRIGDFRFFFCSNEGQESPHIHVQSGKDLAKFWLDPVSLSVNHGFSERVLTEIGQVIEEHQTELVEAWNDYFN